MADGWQPDKRWADRFEPAIRLILAQYLIRPATRVEDTEQGTDLCFVIAGGTIGCRVRDADKYLARYPYDWTLRRTRPSGIKSELTKIIDLGKPDWYVYALGHGDSGELARWILVDMQAFRAQWMRHGVRGFGVADSDDPDAIKGTVKPNRDGSSDFVAVNVRSLAPQCFVAVSPGFWKTPAKAA